MCIGRHLVLCPKVETLIKLKKDDLADYSVSSLLYACLCPRIELGVLSVVAQQILTIQHAKASQTREFQFEGR